MSSFELLKLLNDFWWDVLNGAKRVERFERLEQLEHLELTGF
jgi:hypothetical protein